MTLLPLPAFNDNYIWVLHDGRRALVVDPGESEGVMKWLVSEGVVLDTILVTHHHGDHTGGVDALRLATGARVIGPAHEVVPEPLQRVADGDSIETLGLRFEVLDVPGHTAGHIAYHCAEVVGRPLLFCGDTLFSAGCGRLFEGTPEQMLASLDRLAALPDDTRVCCTHEYTLSNLRFARAVDPANTDLQTYEQHCQALRERNLPTLPSSIGLEKRINPFLRVRAPALSEAARRHDPETPSDALGVFTTLRAWKNVFQ
ncbi:hydroxyacylglutathione hydrolase [Hydrogenophaga pseudoflava]|uniref:hydroxyacylglutathione hydrolase n=1 Tax=Hydrogenophaga pseudoflava TaxID=47421 RepID=UPI0027E3FBD1|nr:hydroxyacylglutathione hydrolase [Hydrogenophaga pseudoflava]MDQ7744322.1 hydroxyacylglutathione hydrolase [Hydrogenophaga pseudoflava]